MKNSKSRWLDREIYAQGEDLYTTVVHYLSASVLLTQKYRVLPQEHCLDGRLFRETTFKHSTWGKAD